MDQELFKKLKEEYTQATAARAEAENKVVEAKAAQSEVVRRLNECIAPLSRLEYLDETYSVVCKGGTFFLRGAKKGGVAK